MTQIKVPFVGLNDYIFKKIIFIGSLVTSMYLPNDTNSAHMNKTLILNGCEHYFISTAQDHYFGMVVHNIAKNHSAKIYIHVGVWVFLKKSVSINDSMKGNLI